MKNKYSLANLVICNYDKVSEGKTINISDGRFTNKPASEKFNLKGYVAFPGLINAHDHLLGSYFPKVGNGPYLNWKPWDDDLKNSKLYDERKNLGVDELYEIGMYRHILSGATTVCDHMPHAANERQVRKLKIRLVDQYCVAHEISSYELKWGRKHEIEIKEAREKDIPFITHIEEGFDAESLRGVEILDKKNGIFENSVLVHAIGCSKQDISLIAEKKSSIVWCPNSNLFMFDKTASIKEFIEQGVNVCLGTDSPMSGSVNLLEEMKFAKSFFKEFYSIDLDDRYIMKMVTTNGAKAFKLEGKLGEISNNYLADLILVEANLPYNDPYEMLTDLSTSDLAAVIKEGIPLYFKEEMIDKIKVENLEENYQKVKLLNKKDGKNFAAYLIGRPLNCLSNLREKVGFDKELPFLPFSSI